MSGAGPHPRGCASAALGLAAAAWGGLALLGYDLWRGAAARFPASPYLPLQFRFYVALPAVAAITSLVLLALVLRWPTLAKLAVIVGVVALFALVPYLLVYTGGV